MGVRNPLPETQPKWTMVDVARLAGVSVKTVSRVVNDEPNVNDATRHRVRQVMEDLGYQPHSGARSMRGRAPNCVGITLGAPADDVPLSEDLLAWMFRQLYLLFGAAGNYVCFDLNPHAFGLRSDYARGLWERLYRAIIVTGPLPVDDSILARIHGSGQPYLALGRLGSLPECSSATVDYEEGAYAATRHLIQRGHRRIGLLITLDGYTPGQERRQGYRRALEEAGLPFDASLVESARFTSGSVVQGIHRLLMNPGVTALVDSSGTEDGHSLREGFRRAGRVPGQDTEIIPWTYTCDGAVLKEAQAHVWLPVREATRTGFEKLAEWMDGSTEGPVSVLFRPLLQLEAKVDLIKRTRFVFDTRD